MAYVNDLPDADRIKETTTTTGTGTITLAGAVSGYRAFSSVASDGDVVRYTIKDATNWENVIGVYSSNTLTRVTVISSSNSGAAVSFPAGTKDVFIGPLSRSGSGRWDPMALRRGQTASALDDDWSAGGTSIPAGWTLVGTAPTDLDVGDAMRGHLRLHAAGVASTRVNAYVKDVPAGDFAIQTQVTVDATNVNLHHGGLILADGVADSSNVLILNNYQDGTNGASDGAKTGVQSGTFANITTNPLSFAPLATSLNPVVLRMERRSSSLFVEWSPDGWTRRRFNVTSAWAHTPTKFGIEWSPWSSNIELHTMFAPWRYSDDPDERWGDFL